MPDCRLGGDPNIQTPRRSSFLWTDHALALISKYRQNPLRAARVLAPLHAAMQDAFVLAGEGGAASIAVHRARSLVLAYLYPQEAPARLEAIGV